MSTHLQRIVDDVGSRLQRSVAIDDPNMNLQLYSPHFGPVDETRLASILQRQAPPDTRAWVESLGIAKATAPMRLPANPELKLLSRVCVPIRFQDAHLGYLWVIDEDQLLTEEQLDELQGAADRAAVLMYRARLLEQLERGQERELLRDLLSGDRALSSHAATQMVEEELLVRGAKPMAIVVRPVMAGDTTIGERERVTIDAALESARGRASARHVVQLVRPDHGVMILASNDRAMRGDGVRTLAQNIHDVVAGRLPSADRIIVGIGDASASLELAHQTYVQALRATEVMEIVPSFGDVGEWGALGIYRTLAQLPKEELQREALHDGLRSLIEDPAHHTLIVTLETYLDHAGDAKASAAALEIHRTSLYYRLARIEELAAVDLKDGEDRLALHLGLKVARLAGMWDENRAAALVEAG